MSNLVFPPMERITVTVPGHLRERFERFVREKGWTAEEGVRILLAYAADAVAEHDFTPEETYNEWAAARAEFAVLRHRVYAASEAIRTMKMNITGLQAKNAQYERSLQVQYARRDRLLQGLAEQDQRLAHPAAPSRDGESGSTAVKSG